MDTSWKIVLGQNNNVYSYLSQKTVKGSTIYYSEITWKKEQDYLDEGYKIVSFEEWVRLSIEQDYKYYNVWKWIETSEKDFDEMYEILPPEEYTVDHKKDFVIFRMAEYLTWNITTHYLRIRKWDKYKYYVWNFDISNYTNIKNLVNFLKN